MFIKTNAWTKTAKLSDFFFSFESKTLWSYTLISLTWGLCLWNEYLSICFFPPPPEHRVLANINDTEHQSAVYLERPSLRHQNFISAGKSR